MAEEKDQSIALTPAPSKGPLILALVNSVAILAAMGMIVYTKLIFKRPVITESTERTRLANLRASPVPPATRVLLSFDPVTINIASTPNQPKPADGSVQQIEGKLHYATVGFAIEIRDSKLKEMVEEMKSQISDLLLTTVGRKSFQELKNVQGRYVLKSQILEGTNQLAQARLQVIEAANPRKRRGSPGIKEAVITNVYFTSFIVQ